MLTIKTENKNMNIFIAPPAHQNEPSSRLYLWKQRTFYIGPILDPVQFSQGAASFAVSLGGTIQFSSKQLKEEVSCRSILIPPGTEIECNSGTAPVAICMLDALGNDYSSLLPLMQNNVQNIAYGIKKEDSYIEAFTEHFYHEQPPEDIYQCLDTLIPLYHQENRHHNVDPRIAKVIDLIQENINDNLSIEILAGNVELSVPRLTQLFRLQTGVPIRRYRLWHRLFCSMADLTKNGSLTSSAIDAGFSDASHFNRTFKSMFGMTPTNLLMQSNGIKIFTE